MAAEPTKDTRAQMRALRGSAWVLAGAVVATGATLAVNIALVHLLTPGGVGVYYLTLSVATFCAIVARFGMDNAAVRVIPRALNSQKPGMARSTVVRTLWITLAVGAALGVTLGAGVWRILAREVFSSPRTASLADIAALVLVLLALEGTATGWLRGFQEMRAVAAFSALTPIFLGLVLGTVWLASGSLTARSAVAARGVTSLLLLFFTGAVLSRRVFALPRRPHVPLSELADMGWAMMGSRLVASLTGTTSDLSIVGAFAATTEVGRYGVAVSVSNLVAAPFVAATVVLGPMIAEMHESRARSEMERLIRSSTGIVALPTLAATAGILAFGRPALGFVYGADYRKAASILIFLSLAQSVFVLTGPCALVLMMTGHHRIVFVLSLVAAGCSVGADIWAAQRWGAVGVAAATSAVLAADNVVTTVIARRILGIWTVASFRISDFRLLRDVARRRREVAL